jgi:hypothetical protein
MNYGIVSGCVDETGNWVSGEGFTVKSSSPGIVDVSFHNEWRFRHSPAVVATQMYPGDPTSTIVVNTLANVIVVGVTVDCFRLITGAPNGRPVGRKFNFIAAGSFGGAPE